jgi:hypothetical protein
MIVVEEGAEFFFQPVIEEWCMASSLKEQRSLEQFAEACGDEAAMALLVIYPYKKLSEKVVLK